jgi:hypothetical protein
MMTSLTLSFKRAPAETGGVGSILEQTQQSGKAPAKSAPPAKVPAPAQNQQAPQQNPAPPPKK